MGINFSKLPTFALFLLPQPAKLTHHLKCLLLKEMSFCLPTAAQREGGSGELLIRDKN